MAGPDLSAVTAAIDFSSVVVAMLSTFAALAGAVMAWKGAKIVLITVSGYGKPGIPPLPVAGDGWRNFVSGERVSRAELDDISRRHPELREQVRRYSREGISKGWF